MFLMLDDQSAELRKSGHRDTGEDEHRDQPVDVAHPDPGRRLDFGERFSAFRANKWLVVGDLCFLAAVCEQASGKVLAFPKS